MTFRKTYTPKEAMLKAAAYCAYQERCHQEVEDKLSEWGVYGTDAGEIIIALMEQNYLNEERFAKAFAGGKFRVKRWGRNRIRMELKARKVSDYCIRSGMKEIDEDQYAETLRTLAEDKLSTVKAPGSAAAKAKTAQYLIGKGYEADLVWNTLATLQL
jgi:regulatory protein